MTKAQLLKKLQEEGIYPDRLVKHSDRTFTFKQSYFYQMGNSADKIAEKIKEALPAEIIEAKDEWKPWPKTSYFTVIFKVIA
jgi:hypothetical protein